MESPASEVRLKFDGSVQIFKGGALWLSSQAR
jgi:hypothetical protein